MTAGELRHPVLNISPWIWNNIAPSKDGLLRVSQTGQWDGWVSFISAAIRRGIGVVARVDKLLALREDFQQNLQGSKGFPSGLPTI